MPVGGDDDLETHQTRLARSARLDRVFWLRIPTRWLRSSRAGGQRAVDATGFSTCHTAFDAGHVTFRVVAVDTDALVETSVGFGGLVERHVRRRGEHLRRRRRLELV